MSMPIPIAPITPIRLPDSIQAPREAGQNGAFQSILDAAIQNVESSGSQASNAVERFLSGESEELHSTALAVQRAELQFDLFLQVRNKVVAAYQEIMRMQI